jgi:hypothetical protein
VINAKDAREMGNFYRAQNLQIIMAKIEKEIIKAAGKGKTDIKFAISGPVDFEKIIAILRGSGYKFSWGISKSRSTEILEIEW